MKETTEIYEFMRKEVKSKEIAPALLKPVTDALNKTIQSRLPLLISGDQGVGKTYGCQYFAYKSGLDITLINASDTLSLKKNENLIRSQILKPSSKLKLLILDEVEKDSNISFLAKMVKLAKRTTFQTNVILICISNNPWHLGKLREAFGGSFAAITAPYIKTIGKALREKDINYKGKIIRDLRFFRSIVRNPTMIKSTDSISENTFEAIGNFLGADYKERNIYKTERNLNAPLWKWLISNFHHGTFNYVIITPSGGRRNSYPKTNTALYHRMVQGISRASQYNSKELLEFVVPRVPNSRLTHPSTLKKRNKT